MREYSTPLTATDPVTGNLTDDVVRRAAESPDHVAFGVRADQGWRDVTIGEFHQQVRAVAKGLIADGVEAGDRVALMSRTRYEWTVLDYAVWFAGAVSVPIYDTAPPEQVAAILQDSGATAVFVERDGQAEMVRKACPDLAHVWSIDSGALDALAAAGGSVAEDRLEDRRTSTGPDSTATLIYTSGTTGAPRGCVLTHGNFAFELDAAVRGLPELFDGDDAATLLVLPLAHVFARIIQVGCIRAGVRLGHSPEIGKVVTDLGEFRPTFLLAVPRIFEKLFNTASQTAAIDGRGGLFDRAAGDGHRLQPLAGLRPHRRPAPGPAPDLRPPHLLRPAGRAGRALPLRDLRRRPARRAARPLLPGHRRPGPRGLRPDRDHRAR